MNFTSRFASRSAQIVETLNPQVAESMVRPERFELPTY
jgi:hypothetical protein